MPTHRLGNVVSFLRRTARPDWTPPQTDGELLTSFAVRREEPAFAALVARHGPMVLGVCQRILQDRHDAEDAFQATFLVLARKARGIRKQASVGSWLYNVAYRTALSARRRAARRRAHESQATSLQPRESTVEAAWRELRPLLDAELARLPLKYRAPLVLCYLEGKTNAEAARQLGWTKGTVSGRLARARELLRGRLARRGLGGLGGLFFLTLSSQALTAPVPAALQAATVQASALALGGAASAAALPALASVSAASLAEGVLHAMFLTKLRTMTVTALVALSVAVSGAWIVTYGLPSASAAETQADDAAKLKEENERLRQELERSRREARRLQEQIKALQAQVEDARRRAEAERDLAQRLKALADEQRAVAEQARRQAEAELRRALEAEQNARDRAKQALQGKKADDNVKNAPNDDVRRLRMQSANNLKQIALAMHNHHDAYKALPTAAIYGKDKKPLLSWRVKILPFIEHDQLYREFRLDEPWDSEHNKKLIAKMPRIYAPIGVKTREPGMTFYRVFTGKNTMFDGTKGVRFAEVFDGTSNTILAVEAGEAVPWTKPDELPYTDKALPKLGGMFKDGLHIVMADGSVRWVRPNLNERILRIAIIRNDGEPFNIEEIDR